MEDRDFLMWLHERLEKVHGESELVDYMHKLRSIIAVYPPDKDTVFSLGKNGLDELKKSL